MKPMYAVTAVALSALLAMPAAFADRGDQTEKQDSAADVAETIWEVSGAAEFTASPEQLEAVDDKEIARNQENLSAFITDLGVEELKFPGYAGTVNDPATATSTIWWKGDIPAEARKVIQAHEGVIKIDTRLAPHSRTELIDAAFKGRDRLAEGAIVSAAPREDGTGLVVGVPPNSRIDKQALRDAFGVDLYLFEQEPIFPLAGGRQSDSSPHHGGAIMRRNDNDGICSTAFAVLSGNQGRLLSAAHCAPGANRRWNTGDLSLLAQPA